MGNNDILIVLLILTNMFWLVVWSTTYSWYDHYKTTVEKYVNPTPNPKQEKNGMRCGGRKMTALKAELKANESSLMSLRGR